MKFTFIGELDAAVVGSETASTIAVEAGWDVERLKTAGDTVSGEITKGTGFESAPLGFRIWSVSVSGELTSAGVSAMTHELADGHVVVSAVPFRRIAEADAPLPATKFKPCSSSGKPSTVPAVTLEGRIVSIVTPLVIETVAAAFWAGFESVVATIEIAFGDGACGGAVKTPSALIEPQAEPTQPSPGTPGVTDQLTGTVAPFASSAKNCSVLGAPPVAARKE
jgi:hypothetical protein